MSIPVLKEVKVECIEDETPCSDFVPPEAVNLYDIKFEVLKKDPLEDKILEPSHSFENRLNFSPRHSNYQTLEDVDDSYNGFSFLKYLKKKLSHEENHKSSFSCKNEVFVKDDKELKLIDKQRKLKTECNEEERDEEFSLSVKIKEGDRKYQGKRKTERSDSGKVRLNKNENSSIHYDVLVTTGETRCELCDKVFVNRFNLLKHNIEHIKLNIITPELVRKYENRMRRLKQAESRPRRRPGEHKTKLLYYCKYCDKHYKYGSWQKHMNNYHSEKKYKCGLCGKKFRCFYYIENHMKMVHIAKMYKDAPPLYEEMFNCWCGKRFRSLVYLEKHKKQRHKMYASNFKPINVSFL